MSSTRGCRDCTVCRSLKFVTPSNEQCGQMTSSLSELDGTSLRKMDEFCRTCASPKPSGVSLFDCSPASVTYAAILTKYLPVRVCESDRLPLRICEQCASILAGFETFAAGVTRAEELLRERQEAADAAATADVSEVTSEPAGVNSSDDKKPLSTKIAQKKRSRTKGAPVSNPVIGDAPTAKTYICATCGKRLNKRYNYERHLKVHTGETLTCDTCGKQYRGRSSLSLHVRTVHLQTRTHSCVYCGRLWPTRTALDNHVRTHTGEKPFGCDQCGSYFRSRSSLTAHQHIHVQNPPHQCTICGARFKQRVYLRDHLARHGERQYRCTLCDKAHASAKEERLHRQLHVAARNFNCDVCGASFKIRRKTDTALSAIPSAWLSALSCGKCSTLGGRSLAADAAIAIDCPRCGETFSAISRYIGHLKQHGNLPTAALTPCANCGRVFKLPTKAAEHEKLCGLSSAFPCETCGKRCDSHEAAQAHARTHHASCVCDVCGASFLRPVYLKQHMRTAHDSAKLVCHLCGNSFSRKIRLQEHLQRHTGETDFTCHVCGKGSTNAYAFSVHLATHSTDKPFRCSLCPRTFTHTKYVYLHERAVHRQLKPAKKPTRNLDERTCSECGKVFQRESAMWIHRRTVHEGKNGYICNYCGKDFKYTYLLYVHKKKEHFPEKCKYACQYCQKPFPVRTELLRHLHKHTGERPYVCQTCGRAYAFHGSLNMHIRTQHRPETLSRFDCSICGAGYNFKSHLARHMKGHVDKSAVLATA